MSVTRPSITAVVPVRRFAESKQRLGFLLSPAERAALSRAMLADVLAAIVGAGFDQTIVVTDESEFVAPPGVRILREERPAGLNAAIALAVVNLTGAGAMLVVPADVPQITVLTMKSCMAELTTQGSAVLVPAAVDGGTNILGLNPPDLIAPAFGPNSFARHTAALHDIGVKPLILKDSEVQFDIDRPADIARFLATGKPTETRTYLESTRAVDRLVAAKSLETQA